ncbi:hypothetical protein, partial [Myceligenerans halotolerans]
MNEHFELDLREFVELREFLPEDSESDPRAFLAAMVNPAEFASVLTLLFPDFIEYRGSVFLRFAFDRVVIDEWFDRLGDASSVEHVVNHVHLWDVVASGVGYEEDCVRPGLRQSHDWRSVRTGRLRSL